MKKKFSKILGVGLTLALLFSLLLTAAPVSADVTQPTVAVDPATISEVDAEYTIRFRLGEQLTFATAVTVGTGSNGTYDLAEIGDSFVLTAATADNVVTLTRTKGTVAITGSTGVVITGTAEIPIITFNAVDATATVTVLTVDGTTGECAGTLDWTGTTAPTVVVTAGAAADTITIVFESDTAVDDISDPTIAMVAGPGWLNGVWEDATIGTLPATVGTADTRTVVITLGATSRIGEGAEVRLTFTDGITNPSTPGTYNLTVETSKEDTAVTSADYTIDVPTIPGLPGVANVYNPVGVLMAQENDLSEAIGEAGIDYIIEVGPGTYIDDIDIIYDGLTLVSTAGAAATIIEGTIIVSGDEVTVDGFTVEVDSGSAITVTGADDIVQNNIITAEDGWPMGIDLWNATGATVSDNELSINTTMMVRGATDCTLSGNAFGAGINVQGSTGIDITDNDIIGSEYTGIVFESSASTDILIEGNTISGTIDAEGTGIYFRPGIGGDKIQIIGNDIIDNEGEAIGITTVALTNSVIKFNTITGNNIETGDHAIQNDSSADVDATLNWWGTAVADDIADMVSADVVIYEPFLTGTAEAVLSASDAGTGATLDAKDTAGVAVSVATTAVTVDTIAVAKYIANPQEALADVIAFFDVYVAGTGTWDTDDSVTIKFYAGDANTEVYIWSADTLTWGAVTPVSYSAYGGYVYVTIEDPAMLAGTPFALVGGAGAALEAPAIAAPTTGDDTVSLTPIFAWGVVAGADGYNFQLADNANFVTPMVKLDGDLGRLVVTAYAYVGELPYSTAYYWRVQAVSGTVAAGDLGESPWSTGVFITMDEPAEELPPVVVQEQPPVIIEPIVEVITPAATEITPSWIYVIIGVGAVLVIALLVLIVRTRRVA